LFFVLSKTFGVMLLPTNLLIGIGFLGALLLATRLARLGRRLLVASIVLLGISGFSPLGNWLLYPLE
jgi:threonine/homoserine efflux transporter RhtA